MPRGVFSRVQPTLETDRLLLRPYRLDDAAAVQRLAGDARIADTTTAIPHPYPDGAAEAWIAGHATAFRAGTLVNYAVVHRASDRLIGTVSLLDISSEQARAELGYWTAVELWGQGFCTEAVVRLIGFARDHLALTRIVGRCLARNPASARVLQKAGLELEGRFRKDVRKNGRFEDVLFFGRVLPDRR